MDSIQGRSDKAKNFLVNNPSCISAPLPQSASYRNLPPPRAGRGRFSFSESGRLANFIGGNLSPDFPSPETHFKRPFSQPHSLEKPHCTSHSFFLERANRYIFQPDICHHKSVGGPDRSNALAAFSPQEKSRHGPSAFPYSTTHRAKLTSS